MPHPGRFAVAVPTSTAQDGADTRFFTSRNCQRIFVRRGPALTTAQPGLHLAEQVAEQGPKLREPAQERGFRPDIEGLRALSVAAVVFYHAHLPGFTGGFVGVD